MVFDVSVSLDSRRQEHALELGEDHLVGLVEHVGEDVEAPAVRHPMTISSTPRRPGVLDDRVEQRDQRLPALEREALLADVFGLQELLEGLGRDQPLEEAERVLRGAGRPVAAALHALDEPVALLAVADVDELDAERAAVGFAQRRDQLAERHVVETKERRRRNDAAEVVVAKPEAPELEERVGASL